MARADRSDTTPPARGGVLRRWAVPLGIVVAVSALIVGVFWMQQDPSEPPAQGGATGTPSADAPAAVEHPESVAAPDLSSEEGRDPDDLLAEGPADAPVVLVVFSDYQCPYCAKWSDETLPELREYVERGELRIEYRDVNIYGADSERAARAALAAAKQDRLQDYADALFAVGGIRSPQERDEDSLVDLAGELDLDTEQFAADLNSEEVAATIDANAQQGIELGAMSTPAFLLDGTPMAGAQPTEVFTDALDEALAEAEG